MIKIYLLFYMCHFAMGLTRCYKTTVFFTFINDDDDDYDDDCLTTKFLASVFIDIESKCDAGV